VNNLHRELAPISDAAWAQIEDEVSRTFKRYVAGRRVLDVEGRRALLYLPWALATCNRFGARWKEFMLASAR
jgi:hypothetical protein